MSAHSLCQREFYVLIWSISKPKLNPLFYPLQFIFFTQRPLINRSSDSLKGKENNIHIISLCKLLTTQELHYEKVGPNSGPVSNSRGDDIRKFSLVLVLTLGPKGFSSDTPVFPFAQKTIISTSFILSGSGMVNEFEPLCKCATPKSLYTNYKLICKPH